MTDSVTERSEIEQPDLEEMTVDDWVEYLESRPDRCLVVNAPDGVHAFKYDKMDGEVTFFANGSLGYDEDGTLAALESVAGESKGLRVQTHEDTYGVSA